MKEFFKRYSYGCVKMFINQFAIAILGASLALATGNSDNNTLVIISGVFAMIFYLFLIYTMTWEIGSKDRISIDIGKLDYKPTTGLMMSLIANIPNFILAVLITLGTFVKAFGSVGAVSKTIALLLNGMYMGLMSVIKCGTVVENGVDVAAALHYNWWAFFVIIVPALIVATVAYIFGYRDYRFTTMMIITNPDTKDIKVKKPKDDVKEDDHGEDK